MCCAEQRRGWWWCRDGAEGWGWGVGWGADKKKLEGAIKDVS
jgi:hypothetical protein